MERQEQQRDVHTTYIVVVKRASGKTTLRSVSESNLFYSVSTP